MPMFYTGHDQAARSAVQLTLPKTGAVNFQFPVKISSDNRRGEWHEGRLPGLEPAATYATSGAREITLNWDYVLDGNAWSIDVVSQEVKNLRGYFQWNNGVDVDPALLVVQTHLYNVGGNGMMSARLIYVNVKHGDTIISEGSKWYPLETHITVDMRLWTQSDYSGPITNISGLSNLLPPDWF